MTELPEDIKEFLLIPYLSKENTCTCSSIPSYWRHEIGCPLDLSGRKK